MKQHKLLLILFASLITLFSACKPSLVEKPDDIFQSANSWLKDHKSTITIGLNNQQTTPEQAFKQGYILVYSEGLPKKDAASAGQRRLTAIRAAEVKAQRDLAVVLSQGGNKQSVRFDNYSSSMQQALRGFQYVSKEYSDELGRAAVLLKYDLRGAKDFVR